MRVLLPLLFVAVLLVSRAISDDSGLPQTTLFYSTVSGIGAKFHDVDGHAVVESFVEDSPASHSGLRPGDRVVRVDGKDVKGLPVSKVIDLIHGPDGTLVNLVIDRDGSTHSFTIKRELIRIRRPNSAVNPH
jgi:C-terminal processing protease CtpA/Prc